MPVRLKPINVILADLNLEKGGKVETFATETCAKHMDKYVPFDEGNLAKYYITGNEIHYDQNYASYQYFGRRKDGSHPINEGNRNRTYHPLATSYWDAKMMTAEKTEVIQEIQDFMRRQ